MIDRQAKVSVILPILIQQSWQKYMTECCIKTMRSTTNIPFELVIVEAERDEFKSFSDIHLLRSKKTALVSDQNAGIEIAKGNYIVYMGNDMFMRPGWLEAMLDCFSISDCGIATLATSDLKQGMTNRIMEGLYGPLMMFKKGWKFDEDFEGVFSDADLIMRIYEAGMRSYRNWRVSIIHLNSQTYGTQYNEVERKEKFEVGKALFFKKHGKSKLIVLRAFMEGWIW